MSRFEKFLLNEGIPSRQGEGVDYFVNPSKEIIKRSLKTSNVLRWVADASDKNVYMWDENKGDFHTVWNKVRHTTSNPDRNLYHKTLLAGKYEILSKKVTVSPTINGLNTNIDGVTSFGWASDWFDSQLVYS